MSSSAAASSKKRPRVTVADLPPGGVPKPDLKLQLLNGEIVETYACAVYMGSPVLTHALDLEPGAVIPIPLDVCAEGMKFALDEMLPTFLKRNGQISLFNPLRRAHRDYVRSLEYLQVPDHERLISKLYTRNAGYFNNEPVSAGPEEDLDTFNFILQRHGPLTAEAERWLALEIAALTRPAPAAGRCSKCRYSPPAPAGAFISTVVDRCRADPKGELAETVRQVMGRAMVTPFAGS